MHPLRLLSYWISRRREREAGTGGGNGKRDNEVIVTCWECDYNPQGSQNAPIDLRIRAQGIDELSSTEDKATYTFVEKRPQTFLSQVVHILEILSSQSILNAFYKYYLPPRFCFGPDQQLPKYALEPCGSSVV